MANIETSEPQSIFILRLSAIGDVCHTIATVQAIQERYPNSKITWLIGKVEHSLVAHLPNIEFIIFNKSNGIKEYFKLNTQLKKRQFDVLLHMQVSLRASLASLCIRARTRWGFDRVRAKDLQWLFTNKKIPNKTRCHVADGLNQFALAIGANSNKELTWNFSPPIEAQKWLNEHIKDNEKYIVISPSASHPNRNWDTNSYIQIAEYLSEKGYKVYITGSTHIREKELAENICSRSKNPLINLSGKTNLPQLSALIERAELLLSPDSGPAHIATIVNTKVVGLYAISNPERTGPYHSIYSCVSVYKELIEEEMNTEIKNIKWGSRLKGHDLMSKISVEDVITSINQQLSI